jgi:hypothetical protein
VSRAFDHAMNEAPEDVAATIQWLIDQRFNEIDATYSETSFGNLQLKFSDRTAVVTISRDRSQWFCDIRSVRGAETSSSMSFSARCEARRMNRPCRQMPIRIVTCNRRAVGLCQYQQSSRGAMPIKRTPWPPRTRNASQISDNTSGLTLAEGRRHNCRTASEIRAMYGGGVGPGRATGWRERHGARSGGDAR